MTGISLLICYRTCLPECWVVTDTRKQIQLYVWLRLIDILDTFLIACILLTIVGTFQLGNKFAEFLEQIALANRKRFQFSCALVQKATVGYMSVVFVLNFKQISARNRSLLDALFLTFCL
mmetsp:Transcript_28758/g.92799  ORF Transcript_28758/g.92799 Transcript_28758/m.92799 type:complete len:120 (+) Transcript_28758:4169-4528(+)